MIKSSDECLQPFPIMKQPLPVMIYISHRFFLLTDLSNAQLDLLSPLLILKSYCAMSDCAMIYVIFGVATKPAL